MERVQCGRGFGVPGRHLDHWRSDPGTGNGCQEHDPEATAVAITAVRTARTSTMPRP